MRSLHLNVQTAKTKIFDERNKEITKALIDQRVDELSDLIDTLKSKIKSGPISSTDKKKTLKKLADISKVKGTNGQKIHGAKKPLEGLTVRAFIRWITAHQMLESSGYIGRLLAEIRINPDHRLMRRLLMATKNFPRLSSIERKLMDFLESEYNIFPHQEAECLRAIRYLSRISSRTKTYGYNILLDKNKNPYVRLQAAYLLA